MLGGAVGTATAATAGDADIPAAFERRAGEWRLVPLFHIFGSEELSAHASGIAALAAEPYLALCLEDAESLGLDEGGEAALSLDAGQLLLPVRLRRSLPAGGRGQVAYGVNTQGGL